MHFLIICFKLFMNFIYSILKLFPIQNKVVFISRQSNSINIDFKMLMENINNKDKNVKIIILTKTLGKSLSKKVEYFFHMFKQMYHIATSKVVILDSYCIVISILKHRKSLKVIQIWHALGSLKKFGYSTLGQKDGRNAKLSKDMNMHKNYTYILTSSKISKPFFQEAFNAKEEQMVVMNLPRVDFLQSNQAQKQMLNKFYKIYPEANNKKRNILYCPTQRKDTKIPTDELTKYIDLEKYNFIIKLHDGTEIIYTNKNKIQKGKNFTGLELLHVGDYIITDYSAIVYEAAITEKPIYLFAYDYDTYVDDRGFYINYKNEMPGPICKNFKDIIKMIGNDYYEKSKEKQFCNKYIENINENATEKLAKFILNNMQ